MTKYHSDEIVTTRASQTGDTQTTVHVEKNITCTNSLGIIDYVPFFALVLMFIIGIFGFIFALKSRKTYKCPECGETFKAEYMDAKTCKVCGANLEVDNDAQINDKTK